MIDKGAILKVNASLQKSEKELPIEFEDNVEITEEMKDGLAQAYGIAGFRQYLFNLYKFKVKDTIMRGETETDFYKGKCEAMLIKNLLTMARSAYNNKLNRDTKKGKKIGR